MNKAFHNEDEQHFTLPASRAMAAQYLLLYEGDEIDNFIDSQRQWTRISARITEHNSSVVAGHIENLDKYLEELTGGTQFEARITGKTLIANKLISFIVNSQVQSLSLAFVLVFIVMFSIFKSWKLGLISIIPNILPILLNFAIMGIFDIPLNSATAIIAAVAIGIAVDDTIHFICQYQMQRTNGETVVGAIQDSIVEKGVPILVTSLIMTGGFGILLFGSFVPTIQFGLLSALIMLFAVISDLVVLPALLLSADS
jgi:predicted RND superfamily exporter protein